MEASFERSLPVNDLGAIGVKNNEMNRSPFVYKLNARPVPSMPHNYQKLTWHCCVLASDAPAYADESGVKKIEDCGR